MINKLTQFAGTKVKSKQKEKKKKLVKEIKDFSQFKTVQEKKAFLLKTIIKNWELNKNRGVVYSPVYQVDFASLAVKKYQQNVTRYRKQSDYIEPSTPILILVDSIRVRDKDLIWQLEQQSVLGMKRHVIKIETYDWVKSNKETFKEDIGLLVCVGGNWTNRQVSNCLIKLKAREKLFINDKDLSSKSNKLLDLPKTLYEITLDKAKEIGLIENKRLFVHEVPLSMKRDFVEVYSKDKKKYVKLSENSNYVSSIRTIASRTNLYEVYLRKGNNIEARKHKKASGWIYSNYNPNNLVNQLTACSTITNYAKSLKHLLAFNEVEGVKIFCTNEKTKDILSSDFTSKELLDESILLQIEQEIIDFTTIKEAYNDTHCILFPSTFLQEPSIQFKDLPKKPFDNESNFHIIVLSYYDKITKEQRPCISYDFLVEFVNQFEGEVITITDIEQIAEYV